MTRDIEESPGVVSMMRKLVRSGSRAGWVMILSGVALSFAMVLLDRGYALAPVAVMLVTAGPGMITGLGFAKAKQAESENKEG